MLWNTANSPQSPKDADWIYINSGLPNSENARFVKQLSNDVSLRTAPWALILEYCLNKQNLQPTKTHNNDPNTRE